MKRILVILVVVLTVSAASAQFVADQPATRDDIVKLFDVMRIRQQMELVTQQLLQQMQGMGREELKLLAKLPSSTWA